MSTLTDTTLGPASWQPLRATATALAFLAGVLVIVGSFLPLMTGSLDVGSESIEMEISAWTAEVIGGGPFSAAGANDVPSNGYPMVFGGIILIGAAIVCWFAAAPGASAGSHRAAGLTTAIGAAFLAATAWTVSVQVQNGVDTMGLLGSGGFGIETEASFGTGLWLMMTAVLMAATAAVLALVPVRQARWPVLPPPPVDPNVATPPFGIVLPTQPPPVPRQELSVDPLTGEPLHVDPFTGQPVGPYSPPAGTPLQTPPPGVPVAPDPHHQPAPLPAQDPHSQNGAAAAPDIVLPPPPPPPAAPPGPAVPLSEDPLAEPPRRD